MINEQVKTTPYLIKIGCFFRLTIFFDKKLQINKKNKYFLVKNRLQ